MPFGHSCEFQTFDACVAAQIKAGHSEESAKRICGALQRDTEEKCRQRSQTLDELLALFADEKHE